MPSHRTPPVKLSPVQRRVASEIVALVRRSGPRATAHVTETELADQLGTSRSPVRAALRHLEESGVLGRDPYHGLALLIDADQWAAASASFSPGSEDPLYLRIAHDRQSGLLPEVVGESELMRRYRVARSTLRKVLIRISGEGWIEPRVGRGWCFLPMIDSSEACDESYLYRQAIEPMGILSPSFQFEPAELAGLRREQRRIADGGGPAMTPMELLEANGRFHEALARWSHNRFIVQSMRRFNALGWLVEPAQAFEKEAHDAAAIEHLGILDAIEEFDLVAAANRLRVHLKGGLTSKKEKLFLRPDGG